MSYKKAKMNIVVGGTFQFPMMLNSLLELGYDVHAYTSTPKFKLKGTCPKKHTTTIIKPFQIISKLTGWALPRWCDVVDEYIFDRIVSIVMRRCDILLGFQNASFYSGMRVKAEGGIFLLDRACPHAEEVSNRLFKEAEKIGISFEKPYIFQIKKYKKEYELATKIIIPSDYSINTFLKMGISAKKIAKVQLGAKIKIPKETTDLPNKLVIGSVGSDMLRKGFYYLIKAFDEAKLKDATLLLKTSKKEIEKHPELKEIILNNPAIEFCGYVDDINDFYQRCSVFCLPSIDDGFGMVVCEAMANALPVITTTSTGASEFIEEGVNGFVVPAGDIGSLKQKLTYFSKKPEKRVQMGEQARRKYLAHESSNGSYKNQLNELLKTFTEDIRKI